MVFASFPFSSPLPVAVARTSQSPFSLAASLPNILQNESSKTNYDFNNYCNSILQL